jgi:hypothetical protein
MPAEVIQANLRHHHNPVVLSSYKPRVQKRPGTIADWMELVSRLAHLSNELARDGRILVTKRREAAQARPRSRAQREAERDFDAVLQRAVEHCRHLANALLATGMSREHLENHLEQCGTERERKPEYAIALLYSKLMGIPFREERLLQVHNRQGDLVTERVAQERAMCWARELRPAEVDDFYRTMRAFSEAMPPLAARFRRGEVHW